MKPTIYFDWDGTIADSMPLCVGGVAETLRRMGLPVPAEEILRRCNGPTYEQTTDMLGIPPERTEEYGRTRLEAELALVPTLNHLYAGMADLLRHLAPLAELCVVSNGQQAYLELCLRTFQLEGVFSRLAWNTPGVTKAENLARLLAERPGVPAVMVGDRLGDIEAGKINHLPTIAACYGYGNATEYAMADDRACTVAELEEKLLAFCAS